MDTAAPLMQGCIQPELAGLKYWGELHHFMVKAPAAATTASIALCKYLLSALWAGSQLAGSASYKTAAAILGPLGTLVAWVGWLCASHTFQITGALMLFVAWQTYFPSRFLIRLVAKLPYCRGVSFEFPPAPDAPVPDAKYVALTIDDGPCPYNTSAVLDALKTVGATATFFIIGSQVEKCDVAGVGSGRNGGEGHYPMGQESLRRMYTEGHELGNHTWHDRPSHSLTPKQLSREICDTHKLISAARQAALTAAHPDGDDSDSPRSAIPSVTGPRTKWFRPGWGWFTPEVVDTAQKLGYHTVLGSVWPWDVYSKWPLLNALYISAKVYPGAVIVLHDRRRHLLPTLQYALPWLKRMGYDVVNLSEAAYRSNGRGPELTPAALEAHNKSHSSMSLTSHGSARSLDCSALANMPQLAPSAAYLARMAKETERAAMIAAMEEAEKSHLKSLKRQEADRRAGIDRKLVDMSAAEKRGIERREREKKEAETRRARRKIEEGKARERYERYVKERAERHEREQKERAEAKRKALEAEERRKKAEADYNRRKDAERKYAAEMVARQKAEREARAAADAAAAAAAAAAAEITAASEAGDSSFAADASTASDQADKKKLKGLALLKKLGKAAQKLGVKDKSSSSSKGAASAAAAAAAAVGTAGIAGVAALGSMASLADDNSIAAGSSSVTGTTDHSVEHSVCADAPMPADAGAFGMYGWYGLTPSEQSIAALASLDAAVAAHSTSTASGTELPAPITGSYVCGPGGRVLLGFDGQPLLLAVAEDAAAPDAAAGMEPQPVLLNSQGEPLAGPHGEKVVMLLGANNVPLADPHGRPVFVAEATGGCLRGVHPDGTIILVPARAVGCSGRVQGSAAASRRVSSSSASGDILGAMSAVHRASSSGSDAAGSIKEASSYAPSLARTSVRSNVSAGAAAAGWPPRSPTPTPVAASPTAAAAAATAAGATVPAAPAAEEVFPEGKVPAVLLLGPSGCPLLGVDNRPLIMAVDEEGVPLVEVCGGHLLLGSDGKPLQLAYSSDGTMVALDSRSRALVGPDGCSCMVALDKSGRPMADESGRAIMLGPAGFVVAQASASDLARPSWSGSAPCMSHAGNTAALLAAASSSGTPAVASGRYEVMLAPQGDASCNLPVVDAADYGAYSYNPAAATAVAAVGAGAAAAAVIASSKEDGAACNAADDSSAVFSQDRDTGSSMLCDQAIVTEIETSSAAAAAEAEAAADGFGASDAFEGPMSPTAWLAHQTDDSTASAASVGDLAGPVGTDLYSQPEQQQLDDEADGLWQGSKPDDGEQQETQETTSDPGEGPFAAATAAGAPVAAAEAVVAAPVAAAEAINGPTAAAAARQAESELDSQASTPRSADVHPAAPADNEMHGFSDSANETLTHQQQGGVEFDDLPVGKIRLSAQGLALTATANAHLAAP